MQNTFGTNSVLSSNNRSLDVLVRVVINSLPSPRSKRVYSMAIRHFVEYLQSQEAPILDKLFLQTYISAMQDEGIGEASINLRLAAIRKLSREADELKIWLKTIEVPEAGVSGMTFWEHLTRDHSFDPDRIAGLTIDEQAKLHAAAHYGY